MYYVLNLNKGALSRVNISVLHNTSALNLQSEVTPMKLIIFCDNDKIHDYERFSRALAKFRIEAICADNKKYSFLTSNKVLPSLRMLDLIHKVKPDIILTDTPYYILRFSKLVGRKTILHLRFDIWSETEVDKYTYPSVSSRVYTTYLSSMKESCIDKADLVLLNSRWLQGQFNKNFPNKLNNLLYVGVDSNQWKPDSSNNKMPLKYPAVAGVFQFSQFSKVRGLLNFIEVIKKMPDVHFYFAGAGPYLNLIEQNKPQNMTLLGYLSKSEVKRLIESCAVFVHPSGLDALPRAIREASLLEKPIVASNIGGIPEMVIDNETGYLCQIENYEQWAERIRFLLDNKDIAQAFGKNARKHILKKFNWQNIAQDFVTSLRELN